CPDGARADRSRSCVGAGRRNAAGLLLATRILDLADEPTRAPTTPCDSKQESKPMAKHSYHRDGREISEDEALDHNGMLRDGVAVGVRMTLRDTAHRPGFRTARTMQQPRADAAQYWRDNKDCLVVHDGSGDPLGLYKPGFRMLDNGFGETAK